MTKNIIFQKKLGGLSDTETFAAAFARRLQPGDIIALEGDLGAGKTAFCRAVIQALGYDEEVPSPTFTLVQIYEPPAEDLETPAVWHFDLYRLEEPQEVYELGIEEAFEGAVSLIEWPDRMGGMLPRDHLRLRLEILPSAQQCLLTLEGPAHWKGRLAGLEQTETGTTGTGND